MKIALATLLALTPISALANEYQEGYSTSRNCFKTEYREEYIPGTVDNPGYVRAWNETTEVICNGGADTLRRGGYTKKTTIEYDNNDCTDGKIAGGILGGGLAAAVSRGDGRWWAIPLGVVAGSKIGCDAAGG